MTVYLEDLAGRVCRLDRARMERYIVSVLRHLGCDRESSLGFIFMTDRQIRRLNRRYKKHDRPTDVLSFALAEDPGSRGRLIGEVYVSVERAIVQSKRFGASADEELLRYVIHGILHLVGYDDRTRRERDRMSRKEDRILAWLHRNGRSTKVLTRRSRASYTS